MGRFAIEYDELAVAELCALRRFDQVAILDAIERHLAAQPNRVSRASIKKLEPPVLADYRLRVGDYRVFYNVDEDRGIVLIVAIRHKGGKTLEETAHGTSD